MDGFSIFGKDERPNEGDVNFTEQLCSVGKYRGQCGNIVTTDTLRRKSNYDPAMETSDRRT